MSYARSVRFMAILLVVGGVVVCCPAAGARSGSFRRLAPDVTAFASDGARYVAWTLHQGSGITVLDTRTRKLSSIALPTGCSLEGERLARFGWPAGAGRFLVSCRDRRRLLVNAATREATTLPLSAGGHESPWERVGKRYIEAYTDAAACQHPARENTRGGCIALYDTATKGVSYRPRSLAPDLDTPDARPICSQLRGKVVAKSEFPVSEFAYSDGFLVEAAGHGGNIRLKRCRGTIRVLGGSGEPENLDPRGSIVTWDTGHPGEAHEEHARQRARLFSFGRRTHRRHSWQLPKLALYGEGAGLPTTGAFGYSTHTRYMVFWIAARFCREGTARCQTEGYSVYSAIVR
jgi:hypothetical protein